MRRDLANNKKVSKVLGLSAKSGTDTEVNGDSIDMQGYDSVMFVLGFGAEGDTLSGSVKVTPRLEESDNDSTWSTVAAEDLHGGDFTEIDEAADADQYYKRGYKGDKRYLRIVLALVGAHTSGTIAGATAIQGHAHAKPVS